MKLYWIGLPFVLISCSAIKKPVVIEGSSDRRPTWVDLEKSQYEDDESYYFLSYVEVPGTSSKSAALLMADEKAFAEPFRVLTDSYFEQVQLAEQLSSDSSSAQRILSAAKNYRPPMTSLSITKRYWEVVENPNRLLQLRAYSVGKVSRSDFEQAKQKYFDRLNRDRSVQKILDEVGQKQRDSLLNQSESSKKSDKDVTVETKIE